MIILIEDVSCVFNLIDWPGSDTSKVVAFVNLVFLDKMSAGNSNFD